MLNKPQKDLRKYATTTRAKSNARFFKTGPGEYGYGDLFIGVSSPHTRLVAKKHLEISFAEITRLLKSSIHEDRLLGLIILTMRYSRAQTLTERAKICEFFLRTKKQINNWDLVDTSAHKILGEYCVEVENDQILLKLAKSQRHWDRRLAMVATAAYIKRGNLEIVFRLSEIFLRDQEDLMHKATGWMLREAGKKDLKQLNKFIKRFGRQMPRTMLRYAIEKMPAPVRQKILQSTRR